MSAGEQVVRNGFIRREWRTVARLLLASIATGAFVSIVLALAVFIIATQAQAATAPSEHGSLLLRDGDSKVAAPLMFTDVHIDVSGMTARVRVEQRFVNPTSDWREGVYVFPLPDKAAVDHLDMRVGDRVIEGQIKERQEARRTYEAAKAEGRKASLVEQERPNMFTTSVAHIGPDEEIVVAIEYQEKLAYDAGTFSLRFPLAITPRYIPGAPVAVADTPDAVDQGSGIATKTDAVPDGDRISPPVADPRDGAINPVAITVELNAGFPLAHLASRYHRAHIDERPGHRYTVTLADGVVPAARDFELTWTPDVGSAPGATLLTEERDGRTFALLMVLPPTADPTAIRPAREVTFIIDTSGSMEGVSIDQAKEALLLALDRLQSGDRFNVVEFNSRTRTLFNAPAPLDATTLQSARSFVRALRAGGGTEMKPALEAALSTPRQGSEMRQVVFLTDGAVGNENELLQLIQQNLGDRRLFTIGIGPAPNTYFLKKSAEAGRGTFTFIGDVREVKDRMAALLRKIENPVLTDMTVVWPGGVVSYPGKLPDLYAGEPVVMTAELRAGMADGEVMLTGTRGAKAWGRVLPLDARASAPGVAVLWARDRIEALMDAKRNGAPADEVRRDVVAAALEHHLVSAYTSLVAVDVTPTKPADAESRKTALPTNLPEGLVYDAFLGGLPQTATPAPLLVVVGSLSLLLALALHRWRRRMIIAGGRPTRCAIVDAARSVC